MDPASAIITFITTGVQVLKLIKDTIDEIRDAPEGLKALQERIADVEMPLRTLRRQQLGDIVWSEDERKDLERLRQRGKKCLDKIQAFVIDATEEGKDGKRKVKRLKWVVTGKEREELEGQMDGLDRALNSMVNIVTLRVQEQSMSSLTTAMGNMEIVVTSVDTRLQTEVTSAISDLSLGITASRIRTSTVHGRSRHSHGTLSRSEVHYTTFAQRLQCPPDCPCRCHAPFSKQIVSSSLVPYIGRINVPRRLLNYFGLLSFECNVRTCRRDKTTAYTINWHLPFPLGSVDWSMQIKLPSFLISIHAPRLIPINAEVWIMISNEDLTGLQELFAARVASIYDVDEDGGTLLWLACDQWSKTRSDDAQKIVRLLAEAGADLDFQPGQVVSAKTLLFYSSLATLVKHPTSTFARQIQTDSISIDICQSVFGIDLSDVAIDVLEQRSNGEKLQAALGFSTPPDQLNSSLDRDSALEQLTGLTLLDYSIHYMTPAGALHALESGADASHDAPMAIAAYRGYNDLLQPLLDAGADVNAIDDHGYSALHWACYFGSVDTLNILIDLADNSIDWDARTQDGKNMTALQLAKASPWWHRHPPSWRDEMLAILHEHGLEDDDEEDGPLRMPGGLD